MCLMCSVVAPWSFHVPFGRVQGMSTRLGNVLLLRHILASTTQLVKQSLIDTKSILYSATVLYFFNHRLQYEYVVYA